MGKPIQYILIENISSQAQTIIDQRLAGGFLRINPGDKIQLDYQVFKVYKNRSWLKYYLPDSPAVICQTQTLYTDSVQDEIKLPSENNNIGSIEEWEDAGGGEQSGQEIKEVQKDEKVLIPDTSDIAEAAINLKTAMTKVARTAGRKPAKPAIDRAVKRKSTGR